MRKRNHKMHRQVLKQDGLFAINNSLPTRPSEVLRIMNMLRVSYELLKAGTAQHHDYDRVGAAINIGLVRAESIGQALVDLFLAAGEAMVESGRIYNRHGKYGFTGPHILVMNHAMDAYKDVLAASSPNQMQVAADESCRRIRAGEVICA